MELKDFIAQEIKRRSLSMREFAKAVDVSSTTIVRALSDNPPTPTLDFLEKLSTYTHVDILTLVAMVKPNATRLNPSAMLLVDRISNLPPDKQTMVNALIQGLIFDAINEQKK
jgi:transcriptional regulator with XRE-family HTH domain